MTDVVPRSRRTRSDPRGRVRRPRGEPDLDEALAAEDPAHVTVVTPATFRRDVVAAVLEHDPDSLLFEKPVATTFDEVPEIAALVE